MLILRVTLLLCLLPLMAAYPVEAEVKTGQVAELNSADFGDLTNGLSDAEVESTLNGLSLDDLNALNKLLDDAGNGPFDLEASLRGHHRQAKKQQSYDDMESLEEDLEPALSSHNGDACHDEDEPDQCTEQQQQHQPPKCKKRPTTKRCTSTTRRCTTTSCKSMDGFLDLNVENNKGSSSSAGAKQKYEDDEECDPEDTMCLQRQQRYKQRPILHDFADISLNQNSPNSLDSLEQLAAQAQREESLKLPKQLDSWISKDAAPDVFNSWSEDKMVAEDDGQPQESEEERQQAEAYERQQLARVAREEQQQLQQLQLQQAAETETEQESSSLDEDVQQNAAPAAADELEAAESLPLANDGDSFIANNEREPVRYRIETEHGGYISSEHELGEQLLQADKEHSELLNYDNYQQQQQHSNNEHNNNNPNQYQLESGKRIKRDNKQTDDAPENPNESYLKKLMDSFPRDQLNSQSNLNVAIRQAKRSHLRVKRS
ncbi:putative mediator of RNA polymerase II transcription subunit 26 [Drosophila grimshawi]|uniref:putative mediator of RNA polymerase II transcription subunit 26 n=1 Tax=Drosophila grimshawi TaxID=7222 RepID=UPI000C870D03|nr:putative mediator of RNA polymerase II transcription subunit 26 [Drosophila grimshawi]